MFNKILDWLLVSSTDPQKWSLAFKGALIFFVPRVVDLTALLCAIGVACGIDATFLEAVIEVLGNIVFWALSIVGGIAFLVGAFRKVWRTFEGTNRVIWDWKKQ